MVTWGLITSFGIFQTDYAERLEVSRPAISWIGTIQTCLTMLIGPVSGRASDAGLVHEMVLTGSFLIVFGLFMTSLAEEYWQLLLSQGICVGLGMGFLYMAGVAVPSTYFKKRRSLAMGIVASGIGVGGVLFPGMYRGLLPAVGMFILACKVWKRLMIKGFPWTMRSIAFVVFGMSVVFNLILRVRIPPRTSGPLVELSAFREPAYSLYAAAFFLGYWSIPARRAWE